MGVNETERLYATVRDIGYVDDAVATNMVLTTAYNTTTTTKNATVILFELDATGGAKKDIKFGMFLDDDSAATFTVYVSRTRAGDLVTFTQDYERTWVITKPASDFNYSFDLGDLPEGLQMRVSISQDNLGDATNTCDATLTYLR